MAQLRYVGLVDKTLVDVAALTAGTVFAVDDDFAQRLLTSFPSDYELVTSEVADSQPAAQVTPSSKKQSTTTTTDATDAPVTTN